MKKTYLISIDKSDPLTPWRVEPQEEMGNVKKFVDVQFIDCQRLITHNIGKYFYIKVHAQLIEHGRLATLDGSLHSTAG